MPVDSKAIRDTFLSHLRGPHAPHMGVECGPTGPDAFVNYHVPVEGTSFHDSIVSAAHAAIEEHGLIGKVVAFTGYKSLGKSGPNLPKSMEPAVSGRAPSEFERSQRGMKRGPKYGTFYVAFRTPRQARSRSFRPRG